MMRETGIWQWEILMSINMEKRKILAVSGARSDYDLLYTVYKELDGDDRFDFEIVITGPHLIEKFGYTAQFIERDGFKIADRILNVLDSDQKAARAASIGYQIPALCQVFNRIRPDIILVAGDREEAISVSLCGAYLDIPVAHFFGGDIAKDGNIDNSTRYAASKYAHIHFPSLEEHKQTLLKLGEDDWRIFPVGNPALDRFLSTEILSKGEILEKLDSFAAENDEYLVLIQHSIITETHLQKEHIKVTLEAIRKSGKKCFINYPNSDAGNFQIIEAYQLYSKMYPKQFFLFQNLDRVSFVNLLRHASCLVGNSSSGILEAPSLGLPVVNVGMRQRGRIHGDNVIFVENDEEQISAALLRVFADVEFLQKIALKNNPYGDGNSTKKIIEVLANIELNEQLIHKNITY